MKLSYGQIVEKRVRQSGHSVTKLAIMTNVNRRSIYNWFKQELLTSDIIQRIGRAINHDFSIDFPELFSEHDFKSKKNDGSLAVTGNLQDQKNPTALNHINGDKWKDKYVILLKKYAELLADETKNNV